MPLWLQTCLPVAAMLITSGMWLRRKIDRLDSLVTAQLPERVLVLETELGIRRRKHA
jgi:hypothetical protein